MKKILELQLSLWRSWNFKTYPILFVLHSYFEHYINKGVYVVTQFHIKKFVHMGWANQKVQPKTKKQIMHISKVLTFPTYLST
jgi:hypothetical protein